VTTCSGSWPMCASWFYSSLMMASEHAQAHCSHRGAGGQCRRQDSLRVQWPVYCQNHALNNVEQGHAGKGGGDVYRQDVLHA
jgi:hypothetical protein